MKIIWYIHGYPPTHNAGAEWMAYDINDYLKLHHDVSVLTHNAVPGWQSGVNLINLNYATAKTHVKNNDIVITHLNYTGKAINSAGALNKNKVIVVVHNTNEYALLRRRTNHYNVIYNSHYTESMQYEQNSIVVRPPLVPDRYRRQKTGERAILLVNCWPDKGGDVLIDLARMMPDRKFIGVLGGYGEQARTILPNLEYIDNTPNISYLYARAEIVIQPSKYESYGKAACEAIATDTPVICTGTPGLKEALDYAGIYVERNAEAYKDAIERLDINAHIDKCRNRTNELVKQTADDMLALNEWICKI